MSDLINEIIILTPFLIAVILLIGFKFKADSTGTILFIIIFVSALTFFHTDWKVTLLVSLAGVVKSFPISLMVLTSIFMMTVMEKTGALAKIVVNFKKIGGGNQPFQIMLINLSLGTFLVSIGATPVTMLPPVLAAMGYSTFISVALPSLGYDPLCTFALLAVPAVFFAEFMGISLAEAGFAFSIYMPLVTTGIAFGMLLLVGKKKMVLSKDGIIFASIAGLVSGGTAILTNYFGIVTLTGVIAGTFTGIALIIVAKLRHIKIIDSSILNEEEEKIDASMPLWRALSPWILLITFAVITNLVPPIFSFLHNTIALPIKIGEVIVNTSVFSQAYFWMLIATLISFPILKIKGETIKSSITIWGKRSYRPVYAAAIYFSVAFIFIYSGTTINSVGWIHNSDNNMIYLLAKATAAQFGNFYPLIVPFIGMLGGFISGSETSSIAMFTNYHSQTATQLGISALVVGSANGIGGGLASVISPAKIQNAAATIDEVGIEGEVIKKAAPIALIMTSSVAVFCLSWANQYPWWLWIVSFAILIIILISLAYIGRLGKIIFKSKK
ncbi:MAG: L-lactate permease [Promethearchaeia archaeon]|nr:MAG: L-lactate permease [Candidatus Lokiarchaeia archaeon]